MAEKNFFDLLKDKMAALRPSEKHRDDDWASLGGRLDAALPQQRRERRAIVLPLLLLAALLSSNAAWWQASRNNQATLAQLEGQISDLQAAIAATPIPASQVVRTDTLWRMVYVRLHGAEVDDSSPIEETVAAILKTSQDGIFRAADSPIRSTLQGRSFINETNGGLGNDSAPGFLDGLSEATPDSCLDIADLALLPLPDLALLDIPKPTICVPKSLISPQEEKKPTEPFSEKLTDALRPKFFKVGANIGWLYAKSNGLMHEGGFLYDLNGVIGLSRHWSVTANFSMGRIHYKAHMPEAILGTPDFPMLPSLEHHLAEMDVTAQKIRQFDLGLRYTFSQPGKPRPYLGLGWGGQTLLPLSIEYEIQHEPTGTIQKGVFNVAARTHLRNIVGLSAGLDIPLSPRFDLTLEGSYHRQWKKPSKASPDLIGIRTGVTWLF